MYDEGRRFAPQFDDGAREMLGCDTVLLATGQTTDLSFLDDGGEDIVQARPGWPSVDPRSLATTAAGVFVAGDLAHGTRLLIDAVASGKKAARSVYEHVTGRALAVSALEAHLVLDRHRRERGFERVRRVPIPVRPPGERLADPRADVELGYGVEEACREASRCLDCGVAPVFDGTRCVLCGGCVDVCPTLCLKLVPLSAIEPSESLDSVIERTLGADASREQSSAILKDEDHCIRCGLCEQRCPVHAISMERVTFANDWRIA